ncbi:hypothetical protein BBW65_07245 [Helicobacter enhydrae]|uniref:Uncharacterized protein n=1 Tax=Helicobacter enhydrae TaxID=222136 RepID=A0A1B1U7D8_9HELI|nr:ankyrin repeat domain-containing protein [Helicobacter enhydrae]ANV98602.1 hypothetical protein BBW65_07245 [Helicobacter enhydrae]
MKKLLFFLCLTLLFGANDRYTAYLFSDDYATVRQGIKLGGDLDARWRGMTPLYNACRSGWTDVVELMIARGADVDEASYGETPLLKVTGRKVNDVELAKVLLGNGADVNAQDTQGNTPLYHAIMNRNKKMIQLLLDNGADMYIKNKRGDSAARYILSKKTMAGTSFSNNDLNVTANSFSFGRASVSIGITNKSKQFMKVSQIAVYLNGNLVGEAQVTKNIAPNSTLSNVATIKLPPNFYQNININSSGKTKLEYGVAVEYSLDNSGKSFEDSKEVELVLW